jgi:hypothetical protein
MTKDRTVRQMWGSSIAAMGWAYLLYDWLYVPFVSWMGVQPWTPTWLGILFVGTGIVLNLFQFAIGAVPKRQR